MKRVLLLISVFTLVFAGMVQAVTIADINGATFNNGCGSGCFKIDDKEFRHISVSSNVDPTLVNVSGSFSGGTDFITFGGPFSTTGTLDIQLFYDVTALSGLIAAIDQSFNLSAGGAGGTVLIGETVRSGSQSGTTVAQSSVSFNVTCDCEDPPGEPAQGDQLVINPPLTQVFVSKDIMLHASSVAGSQVGATIITQSFHQVPEPIHYSLLLCGGLIAGLYFKSRNRAQA